MAKKIKKRIGWVLTSLFSMLLSLFATGCEKTDDENDKQVGVALYGVPVACSITGTVKDLSGDPIKGIEVSLQDDGTVIAKGMSNKNGEYVISINNDSQCDDSFILLAKDIDGEQNGGLFVAKQIKDVNPKEIGADNVNISMQLDEPVTPEYGVPLPKKNKSN